MTRWFAMSATFTDDSKIERLGEECGPGGPLALVVLMGAAKLYGKGGKAHGSYRSLAVSSFITVDEARRVLARAGELGVIDIHGRDDREYEISFPKWHQYQEAFRKARERTTPDNPGQPRTDQDAPVARTETKTGTTTETETTPTPFDFPPEFLPYLHALERVQVAKGAPRIKPQLVQKACEEFADRDLLAEIREFEHWHIHGNGAKKQRRDIVGAWRNWLRRAAPRASAKPAHSLKAVIA